MTRTGRPKWPTSNRNGGRLQIGAVAGFTPESVASFVGLRNVASYVEKAYATSPFTGALLVFWGKRGDAVKVLASDGSGVRLFAKRLEQGWFVWPPIIEGRLQLTAVQLALLIEGIDWRRTVAPAPVKPPESV